MTLKAEFQYSVMQSVNIIEIVFWALFHSASLQQGSFWDNRVIQIGSSDYQMYSGEQRPRSGSNHTTWLHALCVEETVCVCFIEVGQMHNFD